ncbi:MAG: helix-turn-helix domain-containing protein, partial [Phycisphaerales bacterium]|nr:helix-turn-helix domain-containing protein [Phycisphaerales bacterium]
WSGPFHAMLRAGGGVNLVHEFYELNEFYEFYAMPRKTGTPQFARHFSQRPKTRYRLWKETGIKQSQLSRLMSGQTGVSVENLERLADAFGLEIIIRPAKAKASKTKGR